MIKARLYAFLTGILLLSACEKEVTPPNMLFEATPAGISLDGTKESSAEFTVTTSEAWTAYTETTGLTFTPTEGKAGKTTITVTATKDNNGTKRIQIGKIDFSDHQGRICGSVAVTQEVSIAPQSILFVMMGRGNLSPAFEKNIHNAMSAIQQDIMGDSRILIYRQTSPQYSEILRLFYDANSGKAIHQVVKSYNEALTSTDGPTLTRIMNDMLAFAPAERYGLIMGSHGTGWIPAKHTTIASAEGWYEDPYWEKSSTGPQTRAFGLDNNKTMDIKVLAQSIEATKTKFEYLIFDACFMSSIEALYDLRHVVPHIVASPCEVMIDGFPYQTVLPQLYQDNGRSYNLTEVCKAFHEFYMTTTETLNSGCVALTNCAELDALAAIMRRINTSGLKTYDPSKIQIYEGLSPHLFFDLEHYVRLSCPEQALYDEFKAQFDRTFPSQARLHTPTFYTGYGRKFIPVTEYSGVTISQPSTKYAEDNLQTNWYKDTH